MAAKKANPFHELPYSRLEEWPRWEPPLVAPIREVKTQRMAIVRTSEVNAIELNLQTRTWNEKVGPELQVYLANRVVPPQRAHAERGSTKHAGGFSVNVEGLPALLVALSGLVEMLGEQGLLVPREAEDEPPGGESGGSEPDN